MPFHRRSATLSLGRGLIVAALTSFFLAAGLTAAEARKLALVVGNSDYASVPKLKNAARDAKDIAAALERLGFEVTLLTDVKSADLWDRVDAFGAEAETAEASVFFYAGHAFQMNGVNHLVPVDAALTSREAIRTETWNLDGIIARLQDRRRQTLIFLDACRNDPVPSSVRGSGAADGLARIQTGVGTFVAFATEPGAVTYDGAGDAPNSPFTTALLKQIETPGLSISDMMIKVRNDVAETTGGRQTPWDQSSLREQFYFQAATESKQELTEADYELLAQLSPEDRTQFLQLLAASGFSEESLQTADDAITVASYNLEVAAESDVTLGAAPAGGVSPVTEELPTIDVTGLEVVEGGDTVGSAVAGDPVVTESPAAPLEVATASEAPAVTETPAAPVEVATAPEAPVVTETPAAPVEVATAPEAPVVTETPAAPVKVATAPEAPVVTETPAAPVEVATAPEAPVVTETPAAPVEVATAPEAPVVTETPVEVAAADPVTPTAPATSEPVAQVPATVIAALPVPEVAAPLGAATTDEEPIRLAALTWETRGIIELNAVEGNRARVEGSEVTSDTESNRALLAAIDPRLLDDSNIAIEEADLARVTQSELARLGCYRMTVDGSWGKGSRTALTSYFLAKKSVPTSLEPTAELVARLQGETQVVCAVQVARAKIVPGKTKAILPVKVRAESKGTPTNRTPKPGRVAKPVEKVKKDLGKSLLGAGNF